MQEEETTEKWQKNWDDSEKLKLLLFVLEIAYKISLAILNSFKRIN